MQPTAVSILVLLDVALKDQEESEVRNLCFVSILVLLDVALKGYLTSIAWYGSHGFNPCSLGCCSESLMEFEVINAVWCFNPCSLGCCSERSGERNYWMGCIRVSILVLLDVALKGGFLGRDREIGDRFNPCSLGCCSERLICVMGQLHM